MKNDTKLLEQYHQKEKSKSQKKDLALIEKRYHK
jgi:hypothetical protein